MVSKTRRASMFTNVSRCLDLNLELFSSPQLFWVALLGSRHSFDKQVLHLTYQQHDLLTHQFQHWLIYAEAFVLFRGLSLHQCSLTTGLLLPLQHRPSPLCSGGGVNLRRVSLLLADLLTSRPAKPRNVFSTENKVLFLFQLSKPSNQLLCFSEVTRTPIGSRSAGLALCKIISRIEPAVSSRVCLCLQVLVFSWDTERDK